MVEIDQFKGIGFEGVKSQRTTGALFLNRGERMTYNKDSVYSALDGMEKINDLIDEGFYITLSRRNTEIQAKEYRLTVEKQIKEDDIIEDEIVSGTLHNAVMQAWQRYIDVPY